MSNVDLNDSKILVDSHKQANTKNVNLHLSYDDFVKPLDYGLNNLSIFKNVNQDLIDLYKKELSDQNELLFEILQDPKLIQGCKSILNL